MGRVIDVELSDAELSIVPVATQIGELAYDEGITVRGALSLWGWGASVDLRLSDDEFYLDGKMDEVQLAVEGVTILGIQGAEGEPKARVLLDVDTRSIPSGDISAEVTVLDLRRRALVQFGQDGALFEISGPVGPMDTCVSGSFAIESDATGSQMMKLSAACTFAFALNLELKEVEQYGDINLVGTRFSGSIILNASAGAQSSFSGSVSGSFEFQGHQVRVSLAVESPVADFGAIGAEVEAEIRRTASVIFDVLFSTIEDYAKAVAAGFVTAAHSMMQICNLLYATGGREFARWGAACRDVGLSAVDVANDMAETFTDIEQAVVTEALQGAGYAVREVTQVLQRVYGRSHQEAVAALKELGYSAGEVAGALRAVYQTTAEETARALDAAGYAANEVGDALVGSYNYTVELADDVVEDIKGTFDEVTDGAKKVFSGW